MLEITEAALAVLDEINRPDGKVLRLELQREQLAIVFDEPRPDDVVIDNGGHQSVHLEAQIGDLLSKSVLDKVEAPEGPKFSLSPR